MIFPLNTFHFEPLDIPNFNLFYSFLITLSILYLTFQLIYKSLSYPLTSLKDLIIVKDYQNANFIFLLGFDMRRIKNFYCPLCNRGYKYLRNMKSHMKYECGKEPQFACPVLGCLHRSKTKSNLKVHMIKMHRNKMYRRYI